MSKRISIILFFLILIFAPRILAGTINREAAWQAFKNAEYALSAEKFERAAYQLFWRTDLWNMVGEANYFAKRNPQMLTAYQKAKEHGVLSAMGWVLLGWDAWQQGDIAIARTLWEEGLAENPYHAPFFTLLAQVYNTERNYSAEEEMLKKSLNYETEGEEDAAGHYRLGLLLMRHAPEDALDELLLAARVDEKFAPAVETLRTSLNLALLEDDPAEKMILVGRGLGLVEEWHLAAEIFTEATQAHPKSASAWAWLGEAQQHIGESPVEALQMAASLQPDSLLVYSLYGLYWQRAGKWDEALQAFEKAAAQEPENPRWLSAQGEVYALMGDLPKAQFAFKQATNLAPNDPFFWYLLASFSVYNTADVENTGLPAAQKALELAPENALYMDMLGWTLYLLGEEMEAEQYILEAIELDPNLGAANLHLGVIYLQRGHRDLAYNALIRAQALSPDNPVGEQAAQLLAKYFQE